MSEEEDRARYRYLQLKAKAQISIPQEVNALEQPDSSMLDVAQQAGKEALMQPGTYMRDLATDPITQAKALPPLAGVAGAFMGGPFSMTKTQLPARALSDAALAAYGRKEEIPSPMAHAVEAATTVGADVLAIPFAHKAVRGSQIGAIEKAAGVPPPQDIPSLPRPAGAGPVSGAIDEAIASVKQGVDKSPLYWKQLKDQISWFYERGKDAVLSSGDRQKLAWLSGEVQKGLNVAVPGRGLPASQMANAMKAPNVISKMYGKIPPIVRRTVIPITILEEYMRRRH